MQILVTGAYGQLGSEINELVDNFPEFNFFFTDIDTLDLTDEEAVKSCFQNNSFDYVINCAAYTAVDKAETDAEKASEVNVYAAGLLAKFSKRYGAKIIHVSTDYVFSGDACTPYSEEQEVAPQGVYGRTKLEGEKKCVEENPETVIIRTSWLYSAFGNNFVKTMLRLGKERSELGVVYDQVGTPTNAADLAHAILEIVKSDITVPGIYHFSNEGAISWYDFALAIFEIADVECSVNPVLSEQFPTPTKRPHYSVLDKAKIKRTYGIKIPYWRESLRKCIYKLEQK